MNARKYDIRGYQDKYAEVWGVESESNPEKIYTVALNKKGNWSCGCPRWTMNKQRPMCKHIKHIIQLHELAAKQKQLPPNFGEVPMPEQVRRKLSTFAAIEI